VLPANQKRRLHCKLTFSAIINPSFGADGPTVTGACAMPVPT
jgi:hypothetical protein